jgi:hypothetical protein
VFISIFTTTPLGITDMLVTCTPSNDSTMLVYTSRLATSVVVVFNIILTV